MKNRKLHEGWPADENRAACAARDNAWAERNKEMLGRRHPNKWVAILNERVIAIADSEDAIRHRAAPFITPDVSALIIHVRVTSDPEAIAASVDHRVRPGSIGVPTPKILQPPWTEPEEKEAPCAHAHVLAHLRDVRFKSVSFDLHGTLVLPTKGWNMRIYEAFKSVFVEAGCADVCADLERHFGFEGAADFVAEVAKKYYRRMDPLVHSMPELMEDSRLRWVIANQYAIGYLFTGDLATAPMAMKDRGVDDRLPEMAIAVHERISGSDPAAWYPLPEQQVIVHVARERGLLVSILSNGSHRSVLACTQRHFAEIPPWQVFTPDTLGDTGKPSPTSAALLLFNMGCAIVRNAIERRKAPPEVINALPSLPRRTLRDHFKRSSVALRVQLREAVRRTPAEALGLIRASLTQLCNTLNMADEAIPALCILPHEHLHVGNSEYHDTLPFVGLGLPFARLLYAP